MTVGAALWQVVASSHEAILTQPDALRAALRAGCPPDIGDSEIELVVAAAAWGLADVVWAARAQGAADHQAVDAAAQQLSAWLPGASWPDARWACAELAAGLGIVGPPLAAEALAERPAVVRPTPAADPPFSEHWIAPSAPSPPPAPLFVQPGFTAPSGDPAGPWALPPPPAGPKPRRRWWIWGLVGGVAAVGVLAVAVAAIVALGQAEDSPAAPLDRLSLQAVQDRYGELGSTLLAGATECTDVGLSAGEVEALECSFPDFVLRLTTVKSRADLLSHRAAATPTVVGGAQVRDALGASFYASSVDSAGLTRLYWDSAATPFVSARLDDSGLDVDQLEAFWDGRGVAYHRRELPPPVATPGPDMAPTPAPDPPSLPEQEPPAGAISPAAAFTAQDLVDLAAEYFDEPGFTCNKEEPDEGDVDYVICTSEDGREFQFWQSVDDATLTGYRDYFSDADGTEPGSLILESWSYGDEEQGSMARFIGADDGLAYIYYDQDSTNCSVLVIGKDGETAAQLEQFWENSV